MAKWLIYVVSPLVYLAFQIFLSESQTITVNPSGTWTDGSTVTLTCTISSYSGEMKWKLGSTDVAKCTPQTCSTISTGEGTFLFGFDTTNHIFNWTIKPVKYSNSGNIFYCFDGTNTANYTAKVQKNQETTTQEPQEFEQFYALSITALILAIILLIAVLWIGRKLYRQKAPVNANEKKPMGGEEMIKHLITECLKKDEAMEKWKPEETDFKECLENDERMKQLLDEKKTIKLEGSIVDKLKEERTVTTWLSTKETKRSLITECLKAEKNALQEAINNEKKMVNYLSDEKNTKNTLDDLIKNSLIDETMKKWLSEQETTKLAIAGYLKERAQSGS